MLVNVTVPVLAESVPDATLLEWNKKAGDTVTEGEMLIELETDKVVLEVVAPASGLLAEVFYQTGDTVLSQAVLAKIDTGGTDIAGTGPGASVDQAIHRSTTTPVTDPSPAPDYPASPDSTRLSPAVRKLVAEHNLDPSVIAGTGKNGRVTKGDVIEFLAADPVAMSSSNSRAMLTSDTSAPPKISTSPATGRAERREPMSRLRQRIAERLVEAQHNSAMLTTFNEVNMAPIIALRSQHKDDFEKMHGVRLGFLSFFVKAAIQGLKRFPIVNACVSGQDIVYHDYFDIGVAVASSRGLVVPVLRNAETMSFAEVESKVSDFGARAGAGSLSLDEMTGGTFTISNGGVFGSLLSTPILNPPQSAILGMHKIQERPVVDNGEIVARPMMYLALSYDHRLIDGREAVLFLVTIKAVLEEPSRLLLDL